MSSSPLPKKKKKNLFMNFLPVKVGLVWNLYCICTVLYIQAHPYS